MIRSFLVLALPLAISAASSSIVAAAADFDVDDVDFKAKVIASSINQFQGNRRKMLNNAFRELATSQACKDETEAKLGSADFTETIQFDTDLALFGKNCVLDIVTGKATCDVKDSFTDVKDSCEQDPEGQVIRLRMTIGNGAVANEWTFKNISLCIGASCNAEEFVKLLQDQLDANSALDETYTVESGAQSTRMHYGAAAASALAMAGVTFLN